LTRARDVANVLSTATSLATDTETAAAISSHNTAANGHVGRGNTASRPASPTVGDTYFDTTLAALIAYKSTGWEKISQDPAPQIASISPATAATTGTTITITGASFKSGLSVQFIGTNGTSYNSPVATFVGASTATATTPALSIAYEPYDVKVINSDNQFAILENSLDAGGSPTWNTASGTITTITEQTALSASVSATDPDGTAIVYSSSNLPAWVTLNSSTGALTGTAPDIASNTTYSFDVTASDGLNTSSRSFAIIVNAITYVITGGDEINAIGSYKYHLFTTNGTLSISGTKNIEICSIGGGGAGGAKGHAGGGGAGELDIWTAVNSATGNYSVVIGAGGTGTSNQTIPGASGGTTTFGSVVSSLGGGGGGSRQQNAPTAGAAGGSGGGGNTYSDTTANGGAANGSNTFAGGRGGPYTDPYYSSGGGGGATAAGANATTGSTVVGGAGGQGYTLTTIDSNLTAANFTSLTGMTVICSGGGGSGYLANGNTSVSGGIGGTGAGNGGYSNQGGGYSGEPTNAVSYGSGGGGAQFNGTATASNGKSGLVIVRYAL